MTVEYTLLLALVTVGGAAAVYSMGVPLIERFRLLKLLISLPIP